MIQSSATIRPPYVYGEILSRSLHQYTHSELPGIGRFISQGMVVGAFIAFLFPVSGMLLHPENGYNFLLIAWLPYILATGIGFGVGQGVLIWACSYIAGQRPNALARATLGIVVQALMLVIFTYFYPAQRPRSNGPLTEWLVFIAIYAVVGVTFGLVSGSKFSPVRELIRGTTPPRWLALNAITGVLLRVLMVCAMMESTLFVLWMRQIQHQRELAFAAIALGHCVGAIVILFTRMPFWLLLLLALLINYPVTLLITDVLTADQTIERNIIIAYLTLWAAFLLCRVSVPHAVLSFVKEEIRYYLID